jgi:hypothetical protein
MPRDLTFSLWCGLHESFLSPLFAVDISVSHSGGLYNTSSICGRLYISLLCSAGPRSLPHSIAGFFCPPCLGCIFTNTWATDEDWHGAAHEPSERQRTLFALRARGRGAVLHESKGSAISIFDGNETSCVVVRLSSSGLLTIIVFTSPPPPL